MGWEQLREVYRQQAEAKRDEETRIPSACPNDGTPLVEGRERGMKALGCTFSGYRWTG